MRILITLIGNSEIKMKLSSAQSQSTDIIFKSKKTKLEKQFKKPCMSISTENIIKNTNTTINTPSSYTFKSIEIKSPKRLIVNQIAKMYERPILFQTSSPPIIDDQFTLPMVLTADQEHKKKLALLDIVPDNAVNNLIKSISKKKEEKNKDKVLNSDNYRGHYKPKGKSETERIQNLLQSTRVNLKHSYLIHYLSKNENCNPTVFARVNKAKTNELSKLNKVCQMVMVNRAQDVLFKENIKKKFYTHLLKTKESIRNKMDVLQKNMHVSNQIILKYPKRNNKLEAYIDNHYILQQKYWNKCHFESLNFKRQQKNKPLSPKQRAFSQGNIFDKTNSHHNNYPK